MAETQRTVSEIYTLLADNSAAAISPQDLRDGFETLRPAHGQMYVSGSGAITISDTTSYFPADSGPTWTAGGPNLGMNHWFDMNTAGQLRYTGVGNVTAHVAVTISFTCASSNQVIHARIGLNGAADAASEVQRKVGTGSDVGSTALHLVLDLATNDYLTVEFRNATSAADVTLEAANVQAVTMPR